jgi:hypothetical protein
MNLPHDAAKRVLKEQVGIEDEKILALSDPKVVSETYTS